MSSGLFLHPHVLEPCKDEDKQQDVHRTLSSEDFIHLQKQSFRIFWDLSCSKSKDLSVSLSLLARGPAWLKAAKVTDSYLL